MMPTEYVARTPITNSRTVFNPEFLSPNMGGLRLIRLSSANLPHVQSESTSILNGLIDGILGSGLAYSVHIELQVGRSWPSV